MTGSLLDIEDLDVEYSSGNERATALRSITIGIPRGQVTAVIGESGSGKSTLAHSIVRLLPDNSSISSGRIVFNGRDILELAPREFRKLRGRQIGFVPQDPIASLNPTKTIGAQIREAYSLAQSPLGREEIEARILQDLGDVGFRNPRDTLGKYPHELSGGQRQRVLVSIAFSQRPSLVIADEPTSALDVLIGQEVLKSIQAIREKHQTTVVIITHDLALASANASHVVVLNKGRLVESGDIHEVFARPKDAYTKKLLANSARIRDGHVASIAEIFQERSITLKTNGAAAPEAIIELRNITKEFGKTHARGVNTTAVDGISLTVGRGRTFALVGESGSGKTTTSRIILGLEQPTSGEVKVFGENLFALSRSRFRDIRRNLQVVYQSPFESLNPHLSVGSIIAEPLHAYGVGSRRQRQDRVHELLEIVQLPRSYQGRRPRELSGGQRQRVAIARALALQPEIVVLDEPVSALDATIQSQVLLLLRSIQEEFGITYFLVTHDLSVVVDMAHTVAVLRSGKIVEYGGAAEVIRAPQHEYTKALLSV